MRIVLNGTATDVADGATVADVVASAAANATLVAVEVNRALVRRAQHATTPLAEGDAVEIVTLVGGG